jgi:hypothetical protein
MDELHRCLHNGPGVLIIRQCVSQDDIVDRTNLVLDNIIAREQINGSKGDHFAPAGKNDRIWNSLQKHAEADAKSFVAYYSNDILYVAAHTKESTAN